MTGLTAEATTVGVARQLWFSRESATVLAARADDRDRPGLRVWVAGAHRRILEHVDEWMRQLPESVLLAPLRDTPPDADAQALVRAVGEATDPSGFVAATTALLGAMIGELDSLAADAGPVADGSLLRAAILVRRDLDVLRDALPTG